MEGERGGGGNGGGKGWGGGWRTAIKYSEKPFKCLTSSMSA